MRSNASCSVLNDESVRSMSVNRSRHVAMAASELGGEPVHVHGAFAVPVGVGSLQRLRDLAAQPDVVHDQPVVLLPARCSGWCTPVGASDCLEQRVAT